MNNENETFLCKDNTFISIKQLIKEFGEETVNKMKEDLDRGAIVHIRKNNSANNIITAESIAASLDYDTNSYYTFYPNESSVKKINVM